MSESLDGERSLADWQAEAVPALAAAGLSEPKAEFRALVAALGLMDLTAQLSHPERRLTAAEGARLQAALARRLKRQALAHIVGEQYFYGRPFFVGDNLLAPRPETELLVDGALKTLRAKLAAGKRQLRVLDLCTGTGCIALTLAAELKDDLHRAEASLELQLLDLNPAALAVAKTNAERLALAGPKLSLQFVEADLWPSEASVFDLITANPPYIPTAELAELEPEVRYEDPGALDGGADGLDFYRRIAAGMAAFCAAGTELWMEHGAGQAEALVKIFATWQNRLNRATQVDSIRDWAGHDRLLHIVIQED